MSGWWQRGFLVVTVCVVVVNSKIEPDSPLKISLCKSFCLAECLNTCLLLQGKNTSRSCSSARCEEGCKHVCQPHSKPTPLDSPLDQARIIIRDLGLDQSLGLRNAEVPPNNHVTKESETTVWRLREVSRIHKSALVLVQFSWLPQKLSAATQPVYLVTWEVGGGVLRGNLLTNSTRVTLSLWPHSVNRIQVTVFSGFYQSRQSEPLVIDTQLSPESALPGSVLSPPPRTASLVPDTRLVAGLATGVAMFILVTLVITWRRQHLSFSHSKLFVEECESPNMYRVFPPAVSILKGLKDSPGNFSSRKNLLID